jgi:hypothetical protein
MNMNAPKGYKPWFTCLLLAANATCVVQAHDVGPWGRSLDWRSDQIDHVITLQDAGEVVSVNGKNCMSGGSLFFRVNDDYAFDIDETVWLDFEFYPGSANANVHVSYNSADTAGHGDKEVRFPEGGADHWTQQNIPLERARFAHLGIEGSDFAILSPDSDPQPAHQFTICNISLQRSYTSPTSRVFGWLGL